MLSNQRHKNLITALKWILLLASLTFIFIKVFYRYNFDDRLNNYSNTNQFGSPWFFLLAFVLMFLNWSVEVWKWVLLTKPYERLSWMKSLASVCSGVTLSIITPNQLGDFAGRMIHVNEINRIKTAFLAVIGHSAQVMVTLGLGLFAFWYLNLSKLEVSGLLAALFVLLFLLALIVYFNMRFLSPLLARLKWLKPYRRSLHVFSEQPFSLLSKMLVLSSLRYFTYLAQYTLLLWFFGVNLSAPLAAACITATFFVQLIVPSFFLLDLGLRGSSALWFMSNFSNNVEGILLASYTLWIINIMIPALAGLYAIFKVKE